MDDNNTSEEISSHINSAEVIDHTYDYNGINLINAEEEADVTSIHYINVTNDISMSYDDNLSINIIHHFYHRIIMKKYLLDHNMIHKNKEFVAKKHYSEFIIK